MTKKLYEISAELVQAQVASSAMSSEEIAESLRKVFNTLSSMQKSENEGTAIETTDTIESQSEQPGTMEFSDPMDSIQQDRVVCLECGAEMRQLTAKHLSTHEMTIREYKKKWGFSLKQSLSARSLSKARSKAAKKRGLPENLIRYREEQKAMKSGESRDQLTGKEASTSQPDTQSESRPEADLPESKETKKAKKK